MNAEIDRAKSASMSAIRVAVGSLNPVKVGAVRAAIERSALRPASLEVLGFDVPSGVPDQPWGDLETRQGAISRAQRCADAFKAAHGAWPDYAVGLEGGVCEENLAAEHPGVAGLAPVLQCFAWMACYRPTPVQGRPSWGFARTGSFEVPPRVVALMRSGMELGDADDKVFNDLNSKQKGGSVAKVTQGVIDRTAYYEHAMLLALAPFVHDESGLYGDPAEPLIVPRE